MTTQTFRTNNGLRVKLTLNNNQVAIREIYDFLTNELGDGEFAPTNILIRATGFNSYTATYRFEGEDQEMTFSL